MRRSRSATPRSLLPLRRVAPERGYDLRRDLYDQPPVRPVFALMRTSWSTLVACPLCVCTVSVGQV